MMDGSTQFSMWCRTVAQGLFRNAGFVNWSDHLYVSTIPNLCINTIM